MPSRAPLFVVLLCAASTLHAQTDAALQEHAHYQLFGGFTFLSNSPNGLPGARQPITGWNISISVPPWRFIRFKADVSSYRGTNLNATENSYYIMGGAQFTHRFGREAAYLEGLMGDGGIGRYWGPNASPGETASFVSLLGGGLDTPLSRRLAFRVDGGFQWTNFRLINNVLNIQPIKTPGLPNNFARVSAGLVWSF